MNPCLEILPLLFFMDGLLIRIAVGAALVFAFFSRRLSEGGAASPWNSPALRYAKTPAERFAYCHRACLSSHF